MKERESYHKIREREGVVSLVRCGGLVMKVDRSGRCLVCVYVCNHSRFERVLV